MSSSWSSTNQVVRSNNILRQHESKPLLQIDMATKARRVLLRARTYNFTLASVLFICAFCALISVPAYIYPTVRQHVYNNSSSSIPVVNTNINANLSATSLTALASSTSVNVVYVYKIQASDLDHQTGGLIFRITFYMWAIVGKLIPCALLFLFSSLLVRSLVQIGRKSHVSKRILGFIFLFSFFLISFYFERI